MSGPVIIKTTGGFVENGSIINNFGVDTTLSLICTSVYQNENIEWIRLNTSGNVEQELLNSPHSSTITFTNPTDDFTSIFRCKSNNTLLFKDVSIINRECIRASRYNYM